MIKAILFDLDGTLLPMDQDAFTKGYFKLLAKKLAPHGYEPETLVKAIWHGTGAMVKNDGTKTNEEAFWQDFVLFFGDRVLRDKPLFEEFYAEDFQQAKSFCGLNPKAAAVVKAIKEKDCRVTLATNPIFPAIATESRIRWAGLEPEEFEFYTTYENCCFSKPNPDYYREVLRHLNLRAEECIMVGNDVDEDMIAESLGMQVFLLTDCMINRRDTDISRYPRGDFDALMRYLENQI